MKAAVSNKVIGFVGNALTQRDGKSYTHLASGTLVDALATRFERLVYQGTLLRGPRADKFDYLLDQPNLEIRVAGSWQNTLQAMKRPDRLVRWYAEITRDCDAVFVRGLGPLNWLVHWFAWARGKRVVHWIAANPIGVLLAGQRGYGRPLELLGLCFAYFERTMLRLAQRVSKGYIVTSGYEIARIFRSKRTIGLPSSSTTSVRDFRVRADTCTGPTIRILYLGFIRREKGIEFLIRALPMVASDKPVHLALVGGWDQFPAEYERLNKIITELGLSGRVSWEGFAHYDEDLFEQIDRSDMLVLPSLSEGSPHVLIEARARSLPIVATRVGGIPDSVTDGEDGLLVPPRDPEAIARALSRIINDATSRQKLIRQGRERVSTLTLEWFADLVVDLLTRPPSEIRSPTGN
jgi:glycosyltransferase involved in cell wall biosynthesis